MMEQYKGAAFGELSPHLFAVADTCYRYTDRAKKNKFNLVAPIHVN